MVEKGIFAPHPMQGWTPDFLPGTLDKTLYDELQPVAGADAIAYAKLLATQEGIFCGISSGGTFVAALKVAERAPKGSTILCVLPDTGERYLSTLLFKDVSELSDEI